MNASLSRWVRIIGFSAVLVGTIWGIGSLIYSSLPTAPSINFSGGGFYNVIFIGILVLVGLSIWQIVANRFAGTAGTISSVVNEQPIRGILIGSVLLIVAYLVYDYFWLWATLLVEYSGIGIRTSLFVVGILVLLAMPSAFVFLSPTGLPVEIQTVKRARAGFLIVWLLFFGWLYHVRPNDLADYKSGASQCYQAGGDPQIYNAPGFSTVTGKRLSKCSNEQALQAAQKPWTYQVINMVKPVLEKTKDWLDSNKSKERPGEEFKPIPSGRLIPIEVGEPMTLYIQEQGIWFRTDGKINIKCHMRKCVDRRGGGKGVLVDEIKNLDLAELHKTNTAFWSGSEEIITITPLDKPIKVLTL